MWIPIPKFFKLNVFDFLIVYSVIPQVLATKYFITDRVKSGNCCMFVQLITVFMVYLWKTCNKKRDWSFKATLIMKPEVAAPLVQTSMLHILWTTLLGIHFNIISLPSWSSRDCFQECFPMKTLYSEHEFVSWTWKSRIRESSVLAWEGWTVCAFI